MVAVKRGAVRRDFNLLFLMMLVLAAGNTALQSVMPAIGRLLDVPDVMIALTFSFSALAWALAAPGWARRSDRQGRKRMAVVGMIGFSVSTALAALALTAGLHGWVTPLVAYGGFIVARTLYGVFGAAAPPAAQAIVVARTRRSDRTTMLTLLASAFGLGMIVGPAVAPFLVLPVVGLAGPAYAFAVIGVVTTLVLVRQLTADTGEERSRGTATAEPSIGGDAIGQGVGEPLVDQNSARLRFTDARIWPWMLAGLIAGHAQAMIGQTLGFFVMDRLALPPIAAQPIIGLVLMAGAGAALLAQWGIIPRMKMGPRAMVLAGTLIAAAGCVATGLARDLHMLVVAFCVASLGFGILRPGFTAGASLAVGAREQGPVAGLVTALNGWVFVLGPALGILFYKVEMALPYYLSAAGMLATLPYLRRRLARDE
jgi:MFS family permease